MEFSDVKERILVVDDEPQVRRSLVKKLTLEGYSCAEAGSGEQALEVLGKNNYDLVLLDIRMPGKSGNEVLPEIRSNYPDTAIIISTAVTDSNIIIDCMKEGAFDYIIKPFDLEEVQTSVARTLHTRQLELELADYKVRLEQRVFEQTQQIRSMFLNAIKSLVFALEAKDKYTAGHSRRVTAVSIIIGQELDLDNQQMEDLRWGALLHDVGKIAVDSAIQNKPGSLTPEEYKHIMTHVEVGPGIVGPIVSKDIVDIIRHHHDRFDGSGLGQTIAGEEIPLGARIVAAADTFDAITSDRPYRAARSIDEALVEMKRCISTQLDPRVVEIFTGIPVSTIVDTISNYEDIADPDSWTGRSTEEDSSYSIAGRAVSGI